MTTSLVFSGQLVCSPCAVGHGDSMCEWICPSLDLASLAASPSHSILPSLGFARIERPAPALS